MSRKARAHLSQDPRLQEIIASTRLKHRQIDGDVYANLLKTIIFQQLSGKAATTSHQRFTDLFKTGYPHAKSVLQLHESDLTTAGLSRQKSGYVRNVAKHWCEQKPPGAAWSSMKEEDVIEQLTSIKGVGLWSAQMILMFTLKRPDVFPTNDLGIRNAIIKRYRLRSRGPALDRRMREIAEPWRPYRSLACEYLWAWIDQN